MTHGWQPWFTATGMAELRETIAKHVTRLGYLRPARPLPMSGGPSCFYCWDQKYVLETGPLGIVPINCPACNGPKRKTSV